MRIMFTIHCALALIFIGSCGPIFTHGESTRTLMVAIVLIGLFANLAMIILVNTSWREAWKGLTLIGVIYPTIEFFLLIAGPFGLGRSDSFFSFLMGAFVFKGLMAILVGLGVRDKLALQKK
jgi:hypothetical protein